MVTRFIKEDSRAELSLSVDNSLTVSQCIKRQNLNDIILEDFERGAISRLSEPKRSEVLGAIKRAREINDALKCMEEEVLSNMVKVRESWQRK